MISNFYFLILSLAFLISSESTRADGHGEKKEVVEEKTMTHPAIAVAEPEKVVEATIEKTQKTINKLVDQGQLDEKKLEIFQNFLSNL